MKDFTLEVCIDTLESARNAIAGGANRLELCAALVIGGTSASPTLFRQIRRESDIKIHAMVRPRFGDFLYTDAEMEQMLDEVAMWRQLGAEGIVSGILTVDGRLDIPRMQQLRKAAGDNMNFTLHRAFDVASDAMQALEDAGKAGVDAILSSGQQPEAPLGTALLKAMVNNSKGIHIMPGGGIDAESIAQVREETGATSFHLSGNICGESPMCFRRPEIYMGIPGMSEFERWECSADIIAAARRVLEEAA